MHPDVYNEMGKILLKKLNSKDLERIFGKAGAVDGNQGARNFGGSLTPGMLSLGEDLSREEYGEEE